MSIPPPAGADLDHSPSPRHSGLGFHSKRPAPAPPSSPTKKDPFPAKDTKRPAPAPPPHLALPPRTSKRQAPSPPTPDAKEEAVQLRNATLSPSLRPLPPLPTRSPPCRRRLPPPPDSLRLGATSPSPTTSPRRPAPLPPCDARDAPPLPRRRGPPTPPCTDCQHESCPESDRPGAARPRPPRPTTLPASWPSRKAPAPPRPAAKNLRSLLLSEITGFNGRLRGVSSYEVYSRPSRHQRAQIRLLATAELTVI